jgi:hypothetical protein
LLDRFVVSRKRRHDPFHYFKQFRAENRCALFLELLLFSTQSRAENRCALFLELLLLSTQSRTENRCALFLELLYASMTIFGAARAALPPRN